MGNAHKQQTIDPRLLAQMVELDKMEHPAMGKIITIANKSSPTQPLYAAKCIQEEETYRLQLLKQYGQCGDCQIVRLVGYYKPRSIQFCGGDDYLKAIFQFDGSASSVTHKQEIQNRIKSGMKPTLTQNSAVALMASCVETLSAFAAHQIPVQELTNNQFVTIAGEYKFCNLKVLFDQNLLEHISDMGGSKLNAQQRKVLDLAICALEGLTLKLIHATKLYDRKDELRKIISALDCSKGFKLLLKKIICPVPGRSVPEFQEFSYLLHNYDGLSSPSRAQKPTASSKKPIRHATSPLPNNPHYPQSPSRFSKSPRKTKTLLLKLSQDTRQSQQPPLISLRRERQAYLLSELYSPRPK